MTPRDIEKAHNHLVDLFNSEHANEVDLVAGMLILEAMRRDTDIECVQDYCSDNLDYLEGKLAEGMAKKKADDLAREKREKDAQEETDSDN